MNVRDRVGVCKIKLSNYIIYMPLHKASLFTFSGRVKMNLFSRNQKSVTVPMHVFFKNYFFKNIVNNHLINQFKKISGWRNRQTKVK